MKERREECITAPEADPSEADILDIGGLGKMFVLGRD